MGGHGATSVAARASAACEIPIRERARPAPARGASLRPVTPWTAQRLGGIVGAALAIAGVIWLRVRATPCPGAVTLEFHPPLADAGSYRFRLILPGLEPCELSVSLLQSSSSPGPSSCSMARELRTQVRDGQVSISELTFASAPERFTLQVKRDGEPIYDVALQPKYAPYPTLRTENKHFCGDRARIVPACLRGSSECQPFPTSCVGPEGCAGGQACCLTHEWGRDYGASTASECASRSSCFAHFGQLACHGDADCPSDLRCAGSPIAAEFARPILTCVAR